MALYAVQRFASMLRLSARPRRRIFMLRGDSFGVSTATNFALVHAASDAAYSNVQYGTYSHCYGCTPVEIYKALCAQYTMALLCETEAAKRTAASPTDDLSKDER
jgi:hypothetical protein